MKVCWFTNVPIQKACRALGTHIPATGAWLDALGTALSARGDVELQMATAVAADRDSIIEVDGIMHRLLGIDTKHFAREMWYSPGEIARRKCRQVLDEWRPDVVHIHGTELNYGLALSGCGLPTVISLQGLLEAYSREFCDGLSFSDILRNWTVRDLMRRDTVLDIRRLLAARGRAVERPILRSDAVFVGRTLYDEACVRAVNPHAVYRYGDEVMASVFYSTVRDPAKVVPHSVFTAASTDNPRKGLHCLLKAIALIKEEFPQLTVRVLGTAIRQSWRAKGYHKYLDRLIRALALEDRIVPLGSLTSESIAAELASADVYAFPSFADNSPSSVTEAMLVGTPIAASFVGGVPSRLRDGETALLFPAGDEIVLAECLRRLLHDRELAQRLAANARAVALERNDPAKVAQQMIDIYRFAIDRARGRFREPEDG